jgi:hypothetical protein
MGKRGRRFHKAIAKYGPENFSMVHLASARTRTDLAALEIILIEQENSFWTGGVGYNLTRGGEGPRGTVMSDATREKKRLASLGRVPTQATRDKLRISSTGRTHSPEVRAKIGAARKGVPLSEERRAIQVAILRRITPEQHEKGHAKNRGRKRTPEFVEKCAAFHRGRKRPLSTRLKIMAAWENRNPQKNLFPIEELMKTRP